MNILQIILAVLGTISLLSLSIYIYLFVKGSSCILCQMSTYDLLLRQKIFLIFAAMGFIICLFKGAEAMLFWIPDEMGSIDSDGIFLSTKNYLTTVVTFGWLALIGGIVKSARESSELEVYREESIATNRFIEAYLSVERLNSLKKEYTEIISEIDGRGKYRFYMDEILKCERPTDWSGAGRYSWLIEKIDDRIKVIDETGT